MKTCILQISYFPDYSFFHLMEKCHLAILIDDMKLADANVAHIKGRDLKIPISELDYINETKINKESSWKEDHLKALKIAYGEEPHFKEIYEIIEERLNQKPQDLYSMHSPELLIDVCFDFIYWVKSYLELPCEINISSKLSFSGFPYEERCALMCQAAGTTNYLSYDKVNIVMFPGISVGKIPKPEGLSIIDAMFKKGKECLE